MKGTHNMLKRLTPAAAVAAVLAAALLAGCGQKGGGGDGGGGWGGQASGKPGVGEPGGAVPVQVATVSRETIEQAVPVTGNLVALQDVQLSAKAAGRVVAVHAHAGDSVRAGQLLVQQDTTDLEANVRQAQANIMSAQAKVSQAISNYQIQQTQAEQDVANAKSRVDAARENYLKVKRGLRPQEILQSENSLLSARASRDNALTILNRNKKLFAQGAIAQADVDQAQTSYDVAAAQYKNAEASLELAREGSRREDIVGAQQQVKQAETAYKTAVANRRQVAVRRADIMSAEAAVAQSRATLAFNQQQVANAMVKSPIDGIVAARTTEPGQIATPGTILMRVVNPRSIYYQPVVPETELADVHVGTPVNVQVDAIAGRLYAGKITAIYPAASTSERQFSLRVTIPNADGALRAGMFARGSIVTRVARDVPVVPATALVPDSAQQGYVPNATSDAPIGDGLQNTPQHLVVVKPDNTAGFRPVKIGIATMDKVQIVSGVAPGDRIVIVGQRSVRAGDKLAVQGQGQSQANAADAAPKGRM
jgi:RND family efflux transporter MFP subunit